MQSIRYKIKQSINGVNCLRWRHIMQSYIEGIHPSFLYFFFIALLERRKKKKKLYTQCLLGTTPKSPPQVTLSLLGGHDCPMQFMNCRRTEWNFGKHYKIKSFHKNKG